MIERITSLQNPRIKAAARLRERRGRQQQQRIIIDGVREIGRAVSAGVELIEAFVCPGLGPASACDALVDALRAQGTPLVEVSEAVLTRLSFGERAEGIVAVARPPCLHLAELWPAATAPVVILEGIEKPGNVGAVLRSADASGVGAVILADSRAELYNPNCIRASLGTVFTLSVCSARAAETLDWLRSLGRRVFAARVDAARDYRQVDLGQGPAFVLGSEMAGLTPVWSAADVVAIRLPMLGQADSLNVSATAAVLCYEALRQREAL